MAMDIEEHEEDGAAVLVVRGEVDLNSSPRLRKALLKALESNTRVGVDLQDAEYMDSSGVATLVEALKSASGKSRDFALMRPSKAVMKVLKLARLDALFDIREAPGEASAG